MKVTITERTEKEKDVELNSCWYDKTKTFCKVIGEDKTIQVQDLDFQLSSIRYGYLNSIDWSTAESITEMEFQEAFERVYNHFLNGE